MILENYAIEIIKLFLLSIFRVKINKNRKQKKQIYKRNVHIPGKSYNEWRETNEEILQKKHKVYYEENKEKISQQ